MTAKPLECDFCSEKELAMWAFEHRRFRFLAAGTLIDAEPGKVAACSGCQRYVFANDAAGLTEHILRTHPDIGRNPITAVFRAEVLAHLTGKVEFLNAADKKPGPRFYEWTCPCGLVLGFDARAYERSTTRNCPRCGREITMISRPAATEAENQ